VAELYTLAGIASFRAALVNEVQPLLANIWLTYLVTDCTCSNSPSLDGHVTDALLVLWRPQTTGQAGRRDLAPSDRNGLTGVIGIDHGSLYQVTWFYAGGIGGSRNSEGKKRYPVCQIPMGKMELDLKIHTARVKSDMFAEPSPEGFLSDRLRTNVQQHKVSTNMLRLWNVR
jgi:hypothetical protein